MSNPERLSQQRNQLFVAIWLALHAGWSGSYR